MLARRKTNLHGNLWRGALRSPESGSQRTMVAGSSRQAITGAMKSPPLLTGTVMAEVWMTMPPPVLMYRPAWRVGPSWITSEALGKGPGVPSGSDTSLTPKAPQGLDQGLLLELGPAPPALKYCT